MIEVTKSLDDVKTVSFVEEKIVKSPLQGNSSTNASATKGNKNSKD
mgnify:CR=1 FL=1